MPVLPQISLCYWGLPNYSWASQVALVIKNLPANAEDIRDVGSIPALGRSPGGGNGNPLQYSCLENPIDKEPGGLKSMRSQRVRHNWSDLACTHKLEVCVCVCECVCVRTRVMCYAWLLRLCPCLLQPHGQQSARLLFPRDLPGKNTGVDCHFLLQGLFSMQGSNSHLLHWLADSLPLGHLGSPYTHTHTHIFRVKFNFLFLCIM